MSAKPLIAGALRRPGKRQAGVMLLEALIAVVIFSIGILALIKMQAEAIRMTSESKMRSDASYLADKVMGDLAGLDLVTAQLTASTVVTNFSCQFTATTATLIPPAVGACPGSAVITGQWQALMARTLPGSTLDVNINSIADPLNAGNSIREAAISVTWVVANAATQHTFSQVARLVE